ncbi:hypothetical protein [Helicobacter sp.]|uniref:hypothetical protein n=1 Tax=Helicobacter sp. TaxID=218 RepID=UPI002A90A64E|nr:hypothetical protein [Helicobacter sp.]MDY5556837.1 hypothetical protein [Helicobacter sp.]
MNDEAIHNIQKSKSSYGIFTSEISHYRLPRKFFKFSRNDGKLTTASLQTLHPYRACAHPRARDARLDKYPARNRIAPKKSEVSLVLYVRTSI